MDVQKEYFEVLLRTKRFRQKEIEKVIHVDISPAAVRGTNFSSSAQRVRSLVQFKDGTKGKVNLIMKKLPPGMASSDLVIELGLFRREILVYKDAVPLINELILTGFGESEISWPSSVHLHCYDKVVLEDLTEKGFKPRNNAHPMDFAHAALVMRALARFHAASKVQINNGKLNVDEFKVFPLAVDVPKLREYFNEGMGVSSSAIRDEWGPEWRQLGEELYQLKDKTFDIIKQESSTGEMSFKVLNHGDVWNTNAMFKYHSGSEDVSSVKLIDFQLAHYGSPAIDIVFFLFTTVPREIRNVKLLKIYHSALTETFTRLNYRPPDLPSFVDIVNEVRQKEYYGLIHTVAVLHQHFFGEAAQHYDLEELMEDPHSAPKKEFFRLRPYVERMREVLEHFRESGVPSC